MKTIVFYNDGTYKEHITNFLPIPTHGAYLYDPGDDQGEWCEAVFLTQKMRLDWEYIDASLIPTEMRTIALLLT